MPSGLPHVILDGTIEQQRAAGWRKVFEWRDGYAASKGIVPSQLEPHWLDAEMGDAIRIAGKAESAEALKAELGRFVRAAKARIDFAAKRREQ